MGTLAQRAPITTLMFFGVWVLFCVGLLLESRYGEEGNDFNLVKASSLVIDMILVS